ncbi:serine dehydratase subunit alpha family protein [Desulfovibrio piger]
MSLSLADRQAILALLHQEVVPALGCTEPIAVALTAARAAEALGRKPERLDVAVSANLLKNGMGVMVPGTGEMGLAIAAAAGALGGKSALGLECLASLDPAQAEAARAMVTADAVELHLPDNDLLLYCLVTAHADGHSAAAELRDSHDNITRVWQDGALVEDHMPAEANEAAPADWPLTLARVYEFATTAPLEEISFILEAARMNRQVAEEGLSSQYGLGVGKSMDARVRKHILSDDLPTFAIRLTAAAADARMAGVMMPVMSNSGSGNQGITCTMPVVACAIRQESSNEDLARALMMSHLTSIHIKHHLGRLSAHCGAMVAATAAGCGIALLLGGDLAVMERTIRNMVGNVAGMICDGAKSSCALKVATAVGAGIQAVMLALDGSVVPGNEGITDDDIEVCIANLGRLGSTGMKEADKVILDIMLKKS